MGRLLTLSVGALLVISATACNGDNGDEAAPPVDTAGTPTSEPAGENENEIIEVIFDGNECTVAGPPEVPPGDYAFVLTDVSGLAGDDVEVVLTAYFLTHGQTYQDVLDRQEDFGGPGSYWPEPRWASNAPPDHDPPEIDLAENQQLLASTLYPESHYIAVYTTNPDATWLCGALDVVRP